MFRSFVLLAALLLTAQCWSNVQLLESLKKACPPLSFLCPKHDYGLFDGYKWEWDDEAIINSDMGERFRTAPRLNVELLEAMKEEFCCLKGPCLFRCGVFPRDEIDLIRAFPENSVALLSLNLPQLEQYRPHVEDFAKKPAALRAHRRQYPAEIEEFMDLVHAHQDLIRSMLKERNLYN
uniref:DUF19 domain-containing protein n=1 Tax=Caenorhabditis tropicalis TaxID=1561998 RepID=A0A1I7T0S6_9PELO